MNLQNNNRRMCTLPRGKVHILLSSNIVLFTP